MVPAVAGMCCVAFVVWLVLAGRPEDRLVAGAGVCLTAIATVILLTMRRRLSADSQGLTIRGPAGARRVGAGTGNFCGRAGSQ